MYRALTRPVRVPSTNEMNVGKGNTNAEQRIRAGYAMAFSLKWCIERLLLLYLWGVG